MPWMYQNLKPPYPSMNPNSGSRDANSQLQNIKKIGKSTIHQFLEKDTYPI
jgi:hypothetical protein